MAGQAAAVLMNSEFATTVAVAVPVILLALGAEARELDKRTRAQRDWPSSFNAKWYSEAEQALESFPDASPDWTAEQLRTQLVHYQQWRGQWVRDRGSSPIPVGCPAAPGVLGDCSMGADDRIPQCDRGLDSRLVEQPPSGRRRLV